MAVVHVDPYEKNISQGIAFTIRYTALIIGAPCLLLTCLLTTAGLFASSNKNLDPLLTLIFWLPNILLIALCAGYIIISRRNKALLARFIGETKCALFTPERGNECFESQHTAYFGLDIHSGTAYYISKVNRFGFRFSKEMLVMGFDMKSMYSFELQGNRLTIITHEPDIPSITIQSWKARMLFEKLQAMSRRHYNYEYSFPGYAELKAKKVTEELGLDLILPRPKK
ncbi:plasmid IncI1-type surface exclusion protein ExcA [Klebsiella aerogenes]